MKWVNKDFCDECGHANDGDDEFCFYCGADLRKDSDESSSSGNRSGSGLILDIIVIIVIVYLLIKIF